MNKINPPWRPEEIAKLYELWTDPQMLDAARIGELIGRPRNSVLGRVFRMRDKEGPERWPMRVKPPRRTKPLKKPRPAVKVARKVPEKIIVPAIPDKVTDAYVSRCHWTDCIRPKDRGHYCATHAKVMYQPRTGEARR